MRGKRSPYFWARHVSSGGPAAERLTVAQWEGLLYAKELADNALRRWREARPGEVPYGLTPADIARDAGVSVTTVNRRIRQARRALFGDLSDAGIYYRLRCKHRIAAREQRPCATPDCWKNLPLESTSRRKYCGSACRKRDWYQRRRRQQRALEDQGKCDDVSGTLPAARPEGS